MCITCCDGVDNVSMSLATIGLTLGSSLSRCLARDPMRITTLCLTASKLAVSGASAKKSSNTGNNVFTLLCKENSVFVFKFLLVKASRFF